MQGVEPEWLTKAADVSCSMAAAEAGAPTPAAPGENPSDERIQQLASVATGQQYPPQPDGSMPGLPPQQFPPGIDPTNPAHQPLLPFDQPPPVPVPVQGKEQEMAIMRERNDGLPLSKEESDDEVHPLPDAASGFRCHNPPLPLLWVFGMHEAAVIAGLPPASFQIWQNSNPARPLGFLSRRDCKATLLTHSASTTT